MELAMGDLIGNVIQGLVGAATIALTFLLWRVARKQAQIYQRQSDLMEGALEISTKAAEAGVVAAEAARLAVDEAQKASQIELRAYIGLDSAKIKNVSAGKRPAFLLQFKNAGRTPARNVVLWSTYKYDGVPETIARSPGASTSNSTVSPDGVIGGPQELSRPLSAAEVAAIRAGKAALYVFGEVTYEDIFGVTRYTRFNLIHGGAEAGALMVCATGNDAD